MKIDYFVLNNEKAQSAAAAVVAGNKQLAAPAKVLVIEDQIVPANSPEVSAAQQQMAAFARSYGTEYIYGQAFAGHYLVDEVLKGSEVVVSADKDILMVGAVGALGICVAPEKLAECLVNGNIELDISDTVYVKIVGDLQTDSRDAARYIVEKLQGIRKNAMICFIDASGALTVTDKMLLCGYCQKLGVVSARFIERSYEADSIIDLSSVKAELPSAAVDAVFIGGAYGGTLEAIKQTAELVQGKQIADKVRLSVAPASGKIYVQAATAGYLASIVDAGGLVLNQCALPPVQARIGEGEVMLSNDIHDEEGYAGEGGKIYLTSTKAAVQAALVGRIGGEC